MPAIIKVPACGFRVILDDCGEGERSDPTLTLTPLPVIDSFNVFTDGISSQPL